MNKIMSNLPLISDPYNNSIGDDSELILLSPLDDNVPLGGSWSLYQEILQSQIINVGEINVAEQHSARPRLLEKGFKSTTKIISTTNNNPKSKTKRKRKVSSDDQKATTEDLSADDQESSVAKKLHHNAKERIRRMKLNASYLALRALMPDSRRSKKRWSAPAIIDRVLKYIPELETEVEALKSKKENVKSAAKDKKINIAANDQINPTSEYQSPTVFVNKINREEAIIQICVAREDNDRYRSSFTNLLQCLEDEDICIKNSSILHICERRICCNLHIQQKNHSTTEADYNVEELSDNVISWLR